MTEESDSTNSHLQDGPSSIPYALPELLNPKKWDLPQGWTLGPQGIPVNPAYTGQTPEQRLYGILPRNREILGYSFGSDEHFQNGKFLPPPGQPSEEQVAQRLNSVIDNASVQKEIQWGVQRVFGKSQRRASFKRPVSAGVGGGRNRASGGGDGVYVNDHASQSPRPYKRRKSTHPASLREGSGSDEDDENDDNDDEDDDSVWNDTRGTSSSSAPRRRNSSAVVHHRTASWDPSSRASTKRRQRRQSSLAHNASSASNINDMNNSGGGGGGGGDGNNSNSNSKRPRENLTEEQKRQNHILSEQKRRNVIKTSFDILGDIVPNLRQAGFSKAGTLAEIWEFNDWLTQGNRELEEVMRGAGVDPDIGGDGKGEAETAGARGVGEDTLDEGQGA